MIWEGWTVADFCNDLEIPFSYMKFKDKAHLKKWVQENQPYYKKHIPEVYAYFLSKTEFNEENA